MLEDGGRLVQETRLWDPDREETRSMRSKESAHDYRYFPEPDLLPLDGPRGVGGDGAAAHAGAARRAPRSASSQQYGLPAYDAEVLTARKDVADYFEAARARTTPTRRP